MVFVGNIFISRFNKWFMVDSSEIGISIFRLLLKYSVEFKRLM